MDGKSDLSFFADLLLDNTPAEGRLGRKLRLAAGLKLSMEYPGQDAESILFPLWLDSGAGEYVSEFHDDVFHGFNYSLRPLKDVLSDRLYFKFAQSTENPYNEFSDGKIYMWDVFAFRQAFIMYQLVMGCSAGGTYEDRFQQLISLGDCELAERTGDMVWEQIGDCEELLMTEDLEQKPGECFREYLTGSLAVNAVLSGDSAELLHQMCTRMEWNYYRDMTRQACDYAGIPFCKGADGFPHVAPEMSPVLEAVLDCHFGVSNRYADGDGIYHPYIFQMTASKAVCEFSMEGDRYFHSPCYRQLKNLYDRLTSVEGFAHGFMHDGWYYAFSGGVCDEVPEPDERTADMAVVFDLLWQQVKGNVPEEK